MGFDHDHWVRDVLSSVNFGYYAPSRFSHFHFNAMRISIKARENWHKIQQIEHIPGVYNTKFVLIIQQQKSVSVPYHIDESAILPTVTCVLSLVPFSRALSGTRMQTLQESIFPTESYTEISHSKSKDFILQYFVHISFIQGGGEGAGGGV